MSKYFRISKIAFLLTACSLALGATAQCANATPPGWTVGEYLGHKLVTTDTGEQWLSPTATLGRSLNDVSAELKDPSSPLYGFGIPEASEVYNLFRAYGAIVDYKYRTANYPVALAFLADFDHPESGWSYLEGGLN